LSAPFCAKNEMTNISDLTHSDLIEVEREILTRVAIGGPLNEVLRDIILTVEKPSGGEMLASVLLTSEDGTTLYEGAAPSLPAEYNAAIDGIGVAMGIGSCGTAAFTGEPVIVSDIATDPLWADYKDLALGHGLQACWSMPIKASDGRVLGTFANYYKRPTRPTQRDLEVIAMITRSTAIAIERHRNELSKLRAEEQRQLLLRELNHRVKNVFALVDSLLLMSGRSAADVASYTEAVRGRLSALSRAHALIQPGFDEQAASQQDVTLGEILEQILAPYVEGKSDRVILSGPDDVMISPTTITGISMVLHELATNAAKYGALSAPYGVLTVTWERSTDLRLVWTERGSATCQPGHSGFGSKLTKRTIEGQYGGTIDYLWNDDGLDITIHLPLTSLQVR